MSKAMNNIIYWVLSRETSRLCRRSNPYFIGIISTDSHLQSVTNKVASKSFGDGVIVSKKKMKGNVGLLLSIFGYENMPLFLLWPIVLLECLLFSQHFKKSIVLNLCESDDIEKIYPVLRFDSLVVDELPSEFNAKSIQCLLKKDGKLFINVDNCAMDDLDKRAIRVSKKEKYEYMIANICNKEDRVTYNILTIGQKIAMRSKGGNLNAPYAETLAFALGQSLGIQSLQIKKIIEGS